MRRIVGLFLLIAAAGVCAEEKGPNTSDPAAIMDWFIKRDPEFYDLKKSGDSMQKKFKSEVQRELAKLPDAPAVLTYLKKNQVLLNWISQYLIYARYTKHGKYSPEEEAFVRKLDAELRTIPTKSQLLQSGHEVSDDTENWLAMKIKVVTFVLDKKYGEKPKEPTKEDEAVVMREIVPQGKEK